MWNELGISGGNVFFRLGGLFDLPRRRRRGGRER